MLRLVYRALWWLVAPLAVLRLLIRSRRERGYRQHIGERFGFGPVRRADDLAPLIWVHAVSVGETRAAQPLIEALQQAHPDARILLTHMTPSGRATGVELYGDRISRSYLPYDSPSLVRRFLRAWRPSLGIVMETEVWPTLIDECKRADIPLVLTNARMSARSFKRAAKFGNATREVFGGFTRVLAQTQSDADRLSALGARNIAVLGNLKFDMAAPPELYARGHAWRAAIGERPVWVAASTREGEEALVLQAFTTLRARIPDALLILVPRHPQRFDEVAVLIDSAAQSYVRRSAWAGRAAAAGIGNRCRAGFTSERQRAARRFDGRAERVLRGVGSGVYRREFAAAGRAEPDRGVCGGRAGADWPAYLQFHASDERCDHGRCGVARKRSGGVGARPARAFHR
jgi:3-deoxy-D-manno-octulosonic-acid transferase